MTSVARTGTTALPDGSRVVLCLGSGGVGKTTVAAALGIAFARRGEKVVVLTIDPARRLADALGIHGDLGNRPQRVDIEDDGDRGDGAGGELWAAMLDPSETFEAVVREEASSGEQAERILANPLFRNLTRSLSGTNEYMAAERLHQLYRDERFDRVVVDTPPSRHALDFLDSPGRLNRFVNHRLYRSVFAPRGLLRTVSAGTRVVLRLLGRIVGSTLVDDVVTFFANFEGLDSGFDRRATEIDGVLHDDTAYVLVTAPRRQALDEAVWIAENVARRVGAVDAVIVNRTCPVEVVPGARAAAGPDADVSPMAQNLRELGALVDQEMSLIDGFVDSIEGAPPVLRLAERARPVADLDALRELASDLDG